MDYTYEGIIIELNQSKKESTRDYARMKRFRAYYDIVKNIKRDDCAQIAYELKKVFKCDDDLLINMLNDDLDELQKCFRAGAYKATLILAGSVLEAFLIDWLSEKDGVDYFKNPYIIKKTNGRGEEYQKEDDRLVTYINAIKELEMPSWMEPSVKANEIRSKRNLVHVKLCLKDDIKIDKSTCEVVISDLKDIIATRIKIDE